jgi:hypothetical protein
MDLFVCAVEPIHAAEPEAERVPARLIEIVELVIVQVHAAGGDLMQQRFPQMRAGFVHERDQRPPGFAQGVAESRGQLEAAGASADYDDPVRRAGRARHALRVMVEPCSAKSRQNRAIDALFKTGTRSACTHATMRAEPISKSRVRDRLGWARF